jgi:hypothetical protein
MIFWTYTHGTEMKKQVGEALIEQRNTTYTKRAMILVFSFVSSFFSDVSSLAGKFQGILKEMGKRPTGHLANN